MRYTRVYPSIPLVCLNRSGTFYRFSEKMDENGSRQKEKVSTNKFYFKETDELIEENKGSYVKINAVAYCRGDIDNSNSKIVGEVVWEDGEKMEVYQGRRNRNPDGSINHTKLYLR